jgi:hypothetical protein
MASLPEGTEVAAVPSWVVAQAAVLPSLVVVPASVMLT